MKRLVIAVGFASALAVLPASEALHVTLTAQAHRASAHATATVSKGQVSVSVSCGGGKHHRGGERASVHCRR
ncbi:MAG: hypothetical protein U0031_15550 [Thermomicrobiales bacterium]